MKDTYKHKSGSSARMLNLHPSRLAQQYAMHKHELGSSATSAESSPSRALLKDGSMCNIRAPPQVMAYFGSFNMKSGDILLTAIGVGWLWSAAGFITSPTPSPFLRGLVVPVVVHDRARVKSR